MKSTYSTTMTAAMLLLLASSLSSTEAFSAGSSRINTIHTKNTNNHHAAIIIAPRFDNHNVAYRTRSNIMQLSATNSHNALGTANLRTKATQAVHKIRTLLLHLSTILTHKSKLILLSTMLSIATMTIPQSAVAKSSGSFFSLLTSSASSVEDTSLVVSKSSSGGKVIVRKVGKFVVTIGAIGAGASFANVVRNKFGDSCNEDDEKSDGESLMKMSSKTEGEIKVTNGNAVKKIEEQTAKKKPTAEIEPMSEEWIKQQLNDVEKRSNVLNDAIKITQPPPAAPVGSSSKKKVSVGNTIGIPSTTPLVKNLDSKIEMLQRRDAERSIEQQRINDEQAQVKMEKKKVAIVEAERKIELAEKEYRKSQQQQVQVVEETKDQVVVEEESPPVSTSTAAAATSTAATPASISIKFGPGGSPAKSRQEDLELTREVILEHVNSMDSVSSGVVDDDE